MTIFTTPVINTIFRWVFRIGMKLSGWKIDRTKKPDIKKAIIIAVPHTSNWDFLIMLAMAFELDYDLHWIGKASLFRGFGGVIARWFGGIPVDRNKRSNFVEQVAERFHQSDSLFVVIAPEGTRSSVKQWKSGFYHMAHLGGADIILAYVDGPSKTCGVKAQAFKPTGNYELDQQAMLIFYDQFTGINPKK